MGITGVHRQLCGETAGEERGTLRLTLASAWYSYIARTLRWWGWKMVHEISVKTRGMDHITKYVLSGFSHNKRNNSSCTSGNRTTHLISRPSMQRAAPRCFGCAARSSIGDTGEQLGSELNLRGEGKGRPQSVSCESGVPMSHIFPAGRNTFSIALVLNPLQWGTKCSFGLKGIGFLICCSESSKRSVPLLLVSWTV